MRKNISVEFTNERIIPSGGLAVVGAILGKSDFVKRCNRMKVDCNHPQRQIKNGDIITIITNTPGLDVAHMGIAFYVDGKLSLLHASSKDKKVTVSKTALKQMLLKNDKWTGIRVLRMRK